MDEKPSKDLDTQMAEAMVTATIILVVGALLWKFFPSFMGILVILGIAALIWFIGGKLTVGLIRELGRTWRGE